MAVLVGRVEGDELGVSPCRAQHFAVAQLEALAMVEGPLLVQIVRQQVPPVEGDRLLDRVAVAGEGPACEALEVEHVDVDAGIREERDHSAPQHDSVRALGRLPDEVRGLVETVRDRLERRVRPQCVDHLLAMGATLRREREVFGEPERIAASERLGGHARTRGAQLEAAEQSDRDIRHVSSVPRAE